MIEIGDMHPSSGEPSATLFRRRGDSLREPKVALAHVDAVVVVRTACSACRRHCPLLDGAVTVVLGCSCTSCAYLSLLSMYALGNLSALCVKLWSLWQRGREKEVWAQDAGPR